jgi:hypothetical protein
MPELLATWSVGLTKGPVFCIDNEETLYLALAVRMLNRGLVMSCCAAVQLCSCCVDCGSLPLPCSLPDVVFWSLSRYHYAFMLIGCWLFF